MAQALRNATWDDLAALEEGLRAEILGGEVVCAPAPLPRHSRAQRVLSRFIGGPFDDDDDRGGPGGWWILLEVDVRLSPHEIVRPDLAGWRRSRLVAPWDQRPIDVVPDWICEVISPSNAAQDRVRKRRVYAQHGVEYYWLVDPHERIVEALHLRDGVWVELGTWDGDAVARIAPFIAVELELGRLFAP